MKTIIAVALMLGLALPAFAADSARASRNTEAIRKSFEGFFGSWNKHDPKEMTAYWAGDASLINPMGRVANGKAEIEKLMSDEQATVFKDSTAKLVSIETRPVSGGLSWYDAEMTVDNAIGADGKAMPLMKMHVAGLMQKKGGKWLVFAARPYAFLPPPAK
jgi:uncharacterized protein (TIGR02246 family)